MPAGMDFNNQLMLFLLVVLSILVGINAVLRFVFRVRRPKKTIRDPVLYFKNDNTLIGEDGETVNLKKIRKP